MKVQIEVELPDNLTLAQLEQIKAAIQLAAKRGALAALQRRSQPPPVLGPMRAGGGPVFTGLHPGGGPVECKG